MKAHTELTAQQRVFVDEYLIDGNASAAAKRAGYSEKTAYSQGWEQLQKPHVQQAIEQAQKERAERTQVTADRVVQELALIAFYNPGRVFSADENGLPQIDFSDATETDWRVLAEVTNKTTRDKDGGTTVEAKVKHQCKLQALGMLMRHLGMNNDKTEHSGEIAITVEYVDSPAPAPSSGASAGSGLEGEA